LTFNTTTNTKPKLGSVYVVANGATCQAIVTATANPSRFVVKP
jgi:LysM repeat protein